MKINWSLAKKIHCGLTNDNYYYKNYIIRKSKLICHSFLNHKNEQLILTLVTNLNVPIIAYFQEFNHFIYITKYLQKSANLQQLLINTSIIQKVATLLKTLHKIKVPINLKIMTWDWKKQWQRFKKLVITPKFNLTIFEEQITNFFKTYQPHKITLCHNDLVPGNILITSKRAYLIDYEYAMKNDPLFDIASFISETLSENPKLITIFLDQFSLTTTDIVTIQWWIHYQNLIWCYWANYLWETTGLDIYFKIMTEKHLKLQKNINNQKFYEAASHSIFEFK